MGMMTARRGQRSEEMTMDLPSHRFAFVCQANTPKAWMASHPGGHGHGHGHNLVIHISKKHNNGDRDYREQTTLLRASALCRIVPISKPTYPGQKQPYKQQQMRTLPRNQSKVYKTTAFSVRIGIRSKLQ